MRGQADKVVFTSTQLFGLLIDPAICAEDCGVEIVSLVGTVLYPTPINVVLIRTNVSVHEAALSRQVYLFAIHVMLHHRIL